MIADVAALLPYNLFYATNTNMQALQQRNASVHLEVSYKLISWYSVINFMIHSLTLFVRV